MDDMPEELYERLAAAFELTLCTSDLMRNVISDINDEGYEILMGVWARGTETAAVGQSACDRQLALFEGEPGPTAGELKFEWRLSEEDIQFLRTLGITDSA
jgi:hypothetical protein